MEMIGEESNVRDRPIYLLVGDRDDAFNYFWYVIEEQIEEEIHHKKKTTTKQIQDDDDRNNNNNISVVKKSETDEIRELRLPPLNASYKAKLVVLNSRIYLFGGGDGGHPKNKDPWDGHRGHVMYLDTNDPEKSWLNGPTLSVPLRTLSVGALQNSGLFIAFGKKKQNVELFAEFLDESLNWRPFPPIPEPERSQIIDARVLAVTDTKVYIHGIGNHNRMGMSFDLQNSEWNIFDRSFHGSWSPGVVLEFCSNSYLFSFGMHGLLKSTPHTQQLWVYDLNNCKWLLPVQDLPDDDTVLPDPKQNRCASTYLLQMNQRNKLALVWSKPFFHKFKLITGIHCTKFVIDCITESDYQHPTFRAKVVSSGSYHVKLQGPLYDCAASLIGKGKEECGLLEELNLLGTVPRREQQVSQQSVVVTQVVAGNQGSTSQTYSTTGQGRGRGRVQGRGSSNVQGRGQGSVQSRQGNMQGRGSSSAQGIGSSNVQGRGSSSLQGRGSVNVQGRGQGKEKIAPVRETRAFYIGHEHGNMKRPTVWK